MSQDVRPDARRVLDEFGEVYGKFTVCGGCDATAEGHVDVPHCGAWGIWIIGDPFGEHVVVQRQRRRIDPRDVR